MSIFCYSDECKKNGFVLMCFNWLVVIVIEYYCLVSCVSFISLSHASSCFSFPMIVYIKCIIVRIYFKSSLLYLLSHFMIVVFWHGTYMFILMMVCFTKEYVVLNCWVKISSLYDNCWNLMCWYLMVVVWGLNCFILLLSR